MTTILMPEGRQRYFNNNGTPAAGCKLYTYAAGTTTPKVAYQDADGTVPHQNPITLDGKGEAVIYWDGAYKVDLKTAGGQQITGYPVDNIKTDPAGVWSIFTALLASAGSSLIGFLQAGVGAVARTVQAELRERISIKQFGALGDGSDATTAIANAVAYCATLPYGARLHFPAGQYLTSATISWPAKVDFEGDGRLASQIIYTGTGDGIRFSGTINSYTPLRVTVRGLTLSCSNAGNTGNGLLLESCAFVDLEDFYVEKFKYGHTLDQVIHFRCGFSEVAQQTRAGVWIVNGADRRVGANQGFTNNIWYGKEFQVNVAATLGIFGIQDDGGVNHDFSGVNFNGGDVLARFAGVNGLRVNNCAFEGSLEVPCVFSETSREAGTYVGPVDGFSVANNTMSSNGVSYEMYFEGQAVNGEIVCNKFASFNSSAIGFANEKPANIKIANNGKLVRGSSRSSKPFFDSSLTAKLLRQIDVENQAAATYVAASIVAGSVVVTPASMENIHVGMYLYCLNEDGTNGEQVLVTDISATQFSATFATAKAANWVIYGQGKSLTEGTWTPVVIGTTTAGTQGYSLQQGYWEKRGRRVYLQGTVAMSAKDAATAGSIAIAGLPFKCANDANRNNVANFGFYTGMTFPAGYTQLSAVITPNDNKIGLRRMGSGSAGASVDASELGVATFTFEATYFVP